jgi:hypothetical protein
VWNSPSHCITMSLRDSFFRLASLPHIYALLAYGNILLLGQGLGVFSSVDFVDLLVSQLLSIISS